MARLLAPEPPTHPGDAALLFPGLARLYAFAHPLSYALLRAGVGLTLFTHGLPKVTGGAHGTMANPMAASTRLIDAVLGLPFAPALAIFVAGLEFLGGLMLAAGLLTRLVAPMFAVQMAVVCLALGPTYPWIDRGFEYPLVLGLLALFIAFRGGGPMSLDRVIGREI